MKYHKTKEGERIPFDKLSNQHLNNIITFIENKAKDGIPYEGTILTGEKALAVMNHHWYCMERSNREDGVKDINEEFEKRKNESLNELREDMRVIFD